MGTMAGRKRHSICDKAVQVSSENLQTHITLIHEEAMLAKLKENLFEMTITKSGENEDLQEIHEHLRQANVDTSRKTEYLKQKTLAQSNEIEHIQEGLQIAITERNSCIRDLHQMRKHEKIFRRVQYIQLFIFSLIIISFVTGLIQFTW